MLSVVAIASIASSEADQPDDSEVSKCAGELALRDPTPARVVGLPGERLYLHSLHPTKCGSRTQADCKTSTYIIPDDEVMTDGDCGGWSLVSFHGTKRTSLGWVASERIQELSRIGGPLEACPVNATSGSDWQASPEREVCTEVQSLLDKQRPVGSLGSPLIALQDIKEEVVPPGIARWAMDESDDKRHVADVQLYGHALKAVQYWFGGMQVRDQFLELWTPDFKRQIDIPLLHKPGDSADNYDQTLISLSRRPYFIESGGSRQEEVSVVAFDPALNTKRICRFESQDCTRLEDIKSAILPQVCHAALLGKVNSAGLVDVTPFYATPSELAGWYQAAIPPRIISYGEIDIRNNGHPVSIGMAAGFESTAPSGDFIVHWPIVLEEYGRPLTDKDRELSQSFSEHAGTYDMARLFVYDNVVYFEHRNLPWAPVYRRSHEVWRVSNNKLSLVCSFTPDAARIYKRVDP